MTRTRVYITRFALTKGCILEGELVETTNITDDFTSMNDIDKLAENVDIE